MVVRGDEKRVLIPMRWGLIPGWWKLAPRVQAMGELGCFLDGAAANGKEADQLWLKWAIEEPATE